LLFDFRRGNKFFNGNGPLKVDVDHIVELPENGNDRLSPQTFDISFGSSSTTDNAGQTSASKMSPASMQSSTSSTTLSPNHPRSKTLQQIPGSYSVCILTSYLFAILLACAYN